jgi:hypothetical protein
VDLRCSLVPEQSYKDRQATTSLDWKLEARSTRALKDEANKSHKINSRVQNETKRKGTVEKKAQQLGAL